MRAECEASLRRLKAETIDLYQIHWPTKDEHENEEGWRTMADLQREGKTRWIGLSNWDVSQIKMAQEIAPVTSMQPPYSLIKRRIEPEILPYCREQGIGVIVYSSMGSGLLTGAMTRERIASLPENDWRKTDERFRDPQLGYALNIVDKLRAIGERHGRMRGEVAIAWTLAAPDVTAAIVGGRSAKQVEETAGAADFRLSDAEMKEIGAVL